MRQNKLKVRLTDHGKDRLHERSGIPKKSTERMAGIAFEKGLKHAETTGALHRYLDYLYLNSNKNINNLRVYGDSVYLFVDNALITVLKVPKHLTKIVQKNFESRD